MGKQLIRIMIVDDHAVVRSGLSAFLQMYPDILLVAEASNADEAINLSIEKTPDVVLLDIVMPGTDGLSIIPTIKANCQKSKILILTSFSEPEKIYTAIKSGADGYLLKNASSDQLVSAIRDVIKGSVIMNSEVANLLVEAKNSSIETEILTNREKEVLSLMVLGCSNIVIAEKLVIEISTVKYHISKILSKLAVNNRTEAVSLAIKQNLVN